MDTRARKALRTIQDCVTAGRYQVLAHFVQRMDTRSLFWPDIQGIIDLAKSVHADGTDKFGREKWCLCGLTTDHMELKIVCAIDSDQYGKLTVFIPAYWD